VRVPAHYSAFLARHRHAVLLTAAAVALLVMTGSAVSPAVPGLDLVVLVAVVALTLLGLASQDRRTDDFVLSDGSFATERSGLPVTWAVADIGLATVAFTHGAQAANTPWAPWLTLLAAYLLPLVVCGFGLWRGVGITLTPDGLRAEKLTGAIFVPWAALSAEQFAAASDDGHLILRYAHPERVRKIGFPLDPERISFAGTSSAFAAAAIQHYVTHPEQRAAIGTPAGLAAVALSPADQPPAPAPGTRRRVRTALAGAALLIFGTPLWLWTAATLDLSGGEQPLVLAVLTGLGLLVSAAFPGITRPAPPATPPAPPRRAPWSRDVTEG